MAHNTAHPRQLEHLSDDGLIAIIVEAKNMDESTIALCVTTHTLVKELDIRKLPAFVELRHRHGVATQRGSDIRWTPEQVDMLRALHLQGLSAQLIGDRIGTTKNAVCGKAQRLGLTLGKPQTKKREIKPRSPRPPSSLKGKPRPPRNTLPAINTTGEYRRPYVQPSGVRRLAAERRAQATRASDRELIEAAIAAGRVTRLPDGHAWGTDLRTWVQGLAS